ncbi:unnamed protein product [Lampetra fluviatilis]
MGHALSTAGLKATPKPSLALRGSLVHVTSFGGSISTEEVPTSGVCDPWAFPTWLEVSCRVLCAGHAGKTTQPQFTLQLVL